MSDPIRLPFRGRPVRRLAAALAVLLLGGCGDLPAHPPDDGAVRVLMFGNSLLAMNDTPDMVEGLARAAGLPLHLESRVIPGMLLRDHWADERGRELLEEGGPWDLVILQEAAVVSDTGRVYLVDYVGRFRSATTAPVGLVMVWAPAGEPEWFDVLHESFHTAATQTASRFIAAGEAWRAALQARPGIGLYQRGTTIYPSVEGAYLNALVLFAAIFDRSPLDLPAAFPLRDGWVVTIDEEVATALREVAAATAARYP